MSETKKRKIRSSDDVKINVIYTEGYQDRVTTAFLNALRRRDERLRLGLPDDVLIGQ